MDQRVLIGEDENCFLLNVNCLEKVSLYKAKVHVQGSQEINTYACVRENNLKTHFLLAQDFI